MQSQLDGVRTGLNLLERALTDISEIKNNMNEMESALGGVPQYYEQLRDVREENLRKEFIWRFTGVQMQCQFKLLICVYPTIHLKSKNLTVNLDTAEGSAPGLGL